MTPAGRYLIAFAALGSAVALAYALQPDDEEVGRRTVVTIATVNNRDMTVMQRLSPLFEAENPDIRLEWLVLEENILRTEPFRQWVLEDRFPLGRPPWEDLGVQFTRDVRPYETLKLRCLNGGHSAVAYAGALIGYEFIHEIARDELFRRFLREFWDREVIPTLPVVPGVVPVAYTSSLIDRFSNPATRDRTGRVCMDGSSKLPTFIGPTIRDQLRVGGATRLVSFVLATWCRYLEGRDEQGRTIEVVDPLADRLRRAAKESPEAVLVAAPILGSGLSGNNAFVDEVERAWHRLKRHGTRATLAAYLKGDKGDLDRIHS